MELKLEAVEEGRLPAGCVVGVRIGDVLKQGKYEPQRCYVFPQTERRRNAKIDLYKHIGSCLLPVDPVSKATSEVSLTSTDPSYAGIKFKVNVQHGGNAEIEKRERDSKTKALKNQAKDYLQQHNIEESLALAVKALLKEQPADPTEFLVTHLRSQAGTQPPAAEQPPAPPQEPAAEPAKEQLPAATPLEEQPSAPAPQAQPEGTQDWLRDQARLALVSASQDGSLQRLLVDIRDEDAGETKDGLRQEACDVLMKASMDGSLGKVLAEIMSEKAQDSNPTNAGPAEAPAQAAAPAAAPAPPAPAQPAPATVARTAFHKPPGMMMNSMAMHGPGFASMGIRPTMMMI